MTTYRSTATINCGRCHTPLTGPTNARSSDILSCPRCGGQIEVRKAVDQAGKQFKSTVEKQLKEAIRKAGFR